MKIERCKIAFSKGTQNLSGLIQKICLDNGITWAMGEKKVMHTEHPFLVIINNLTFREEDEKQVFDRIKLDLITPADFIERYTSVPNPISECKIDLRNFSNETKKEIQEICFANGIFWSGKRILLSEGFIYVDTGITYGGGGFAEFARDPRPQLHPEDFILMYGTKPSNPDTKPSNPKDAAATTRLDISVFPQTAIMYGALGMTEGAYKYRAYNYREAGVNISVYYSALNRHMMKYYNGEWEDKKTKVPHLASALSCIAILIDGHVKGNINDDRPPSVDMAGLLEDMQDSVSHLQKLFPEPKPRCTEK